MFSLLYDFKQTHMYVYVHMKIIAESPHKWQKMAIRGNECINLFCRPFYVVNRQFH